MIDDFLTWEASYSAGSKYCGGKGWNLARLDHYGFAIPAGGVLNSKVYFDLMAAPNVAKLAHLLEAIPNDQLTTPEAKELFATIRRAIVSHNIPQKTIQQIDGFIKQQDLSSHPLVIRSSATLEDGKNASFAGIHDSYLNINGIEATKNAILKCFASLWSVRAVSYRRKMHIEDSSLGCAVVIMKLVTAQSSGIAFSCDPTSGREDITVINANFGLGESVVGGLVEPDEYQLNAHNMEVLTQQLGAKQKRTLLNKSEDGTSLVDSPNAANKQVLSPDQIGRLARIVQCVFWALGHSSDDEVVHQDIEWVCDGGEFLIVQTRPVTALNKQGIAALAGQPDIWSNGNFRDAAPMVLCTLSQSNICAQINLILSHTYTKIGYELPDGVVFSKLFHGRIYFHLSQAQWLYYDAFGMKPKETNRMIGGHQQEISLNTATETRFQTVKSKLRKGWNLLKLMRQMNYYKKRASGLAQKEADFAFSIIRSDISTWSDSKIADLLDQCYSCCDGYSAPFVMLSSLSGTTTMLFEQLKKHLPQKGEAIGNALLAGAGDITSANHGYQLQQLSTIASEDSHVQVFFAASPFLPLDWNNLPGSSVFKKAFQSFLDEYGHRAIYEIDIGNPRWREDPSYLLNIIQQGMGKRIPPTALKSQQKKQAAKAWEAVQCYVPFYKRAYIKSLVKQAALGTAAKEEAKSVYIRLLEPIRLLMLEVGKRLQSRGVLNHRDDIFYCAALEAISLLKGERSGKGLKQLVEQRRERQSKQAQQAPPDTIINEQAHYSKPVTSKSGNILTGIGVATGRAEGIAHVIHTPEQGITLKQGDVLVAPSTDPAWTPLFLNVSAIAMETGGQLSHGAIVAREYGIPAVVNIPGLLRAVGEGQSIVVDGDNGTVELLKK